MKPLRFKIENYPTPQSPLTTAVIAGALSQAATAHGAKLGILKGFDKDRDCGWVILSLNMRILENSPAAAELEIETWVSAIEGALFIREFRISYRADDGQTQLVAEAAQAYILFDRQNRRPVLLPRLKREELKGLSRQLSFSLKLDRRNLDILQASAETTRSVEAQHIDDNGHLNNAVYFDWLSQWIDLPIAKGRIREMAVEFLKEASLGDRLEVRGETRPDGSTAASLSSPDGEVSAYARSTTLAK